MTRRAPIIGVAIAAMLSAAAWGSSAIAQPYGGGYGMMRGGSNWDCPGNGPGWMHGGRGYGRGRMQGGPGWDCPGNGPGCGMQGGRGYGRGWMNGGPGRFTSGDLKMSTDDVKSQLDRWLAWRGNSRLKVGNIQEKDADTIVADIVTKDNSLVQRFSVNRHTGYFNRADD